MFTVFEPPWGHGERPLNYRPRPGIQEQLYWPAVNPADLKARSPPVQIKTEPSPERGPVVHDWSMPYPQEPNQDAITVRKDRAAGSDANQSLNLPAEDIDGESYRIGMAPCSPSQAARPVNSQYAYPAPQIAASLSPISQTQIDRESRRAGQTERSPGFRSPMSPWGDESAWRYTISNAAQRSESMSSESRSPTTLTFVASEEGGVAGAPRPKRTARKARNGYKPISESDKSDEEGELKRKMFLERNRAAAMKCRRKKRDFEESLAARARDLTESNAELNAYVRSLQDEALELKSQCLQHSHCSCEDIRSYMMNGAPGTSPTIASDFSSPTVASEEECWVGGGILHPVPSAVVGSSGSISGTSSGNWNGGGRWLVDDGGGRGYIASYM